MHHEAQGGDKKNLNASPGRSCEPQYHCFELTIRFVWYDSDLSLAIIQLQLLAIYTLMSNKRDPTLFLATSILLEKKSCINIVIIQHHVPAETMKDSIHTICKWTQSLALWDPISWRTVPVQLHLQQPSEKDLIRWR